MLSEFVDIELIDSIVAAILFWDGLTVFLEQFDFVKVGIHVILFFRIEVNNLAVLNPIDCVYESSDLSLIKDKTYIIMTLIDWSNTQL
jgi:hypothetical protein